MYFHGDTGFVGFLFVSNNEGQQVYTARGHTVLDWFCISSAGLMLASRKNSNYIVFNSGKISLKWEWNNWEWFLPACCCSCACPLARRGCSQESRAVCSAHQQRNKQTWLVLELLQDCIENRGLGEVLSVSLGSSCLTQNGSWGVLGAESGWRVGFNAQECKIKHLVVGCCNPHWRNMQSSSYNLISGSKAWTVGVVIRWAWHCKPGPQQTCYAVQVIQTVPHARVSRTFQCMPCSLFFFLS